MRRDVIFIADLHKCSNVSGKNYLWAMQHVYSVNWTSTETIHAVPITYSVRLKNIVLHVKY